MMFLNSVSRIISGVIVAIVIIMAVLLVGVRVAGITPLVVTSGSMEPELPVGSVVYIKEVNTDDLIKGDMITFRITDDTMVTHRIVEINEEGDRRSFVTKGDANNVIDVRPVSEDGVIGKVLLDIPYLGNVSRNIYWVIGAIVIFLVVSSLLEYVTRNSEEGRVKE